MKPILFNTDMVRAILDGRKTVTRRVVKKSAIDKFVIDDNGKLLGSFNAAHPEWGGYPTIDDATYQPGDILYVRETWNLNNFGFHYRADWPDDNCTDMSADDKWRPSIHMPKEAARLFLRVTDVRVERLQAITIDDMRKEGLMRENVRPVGCTCAWSTEGCKEDPCSNRDAYEWLCLATPFMKLWHSTIKTADMPIYCWEANPWVWVIEFERISKEEAYKNE